MGQAYIILYPFSIDMSNFRRIYIPIISPSTTNQVEHVSRLSHLRNMITIGLETEVSL